MTDRANVNLTTGVDGAITNSRAELLVCMLADDVSLIDAWKTLPGANGEPGKNEGGSAQHRNRIVSHSVFVARLADLQEEKTTMLADKIWGKAEWAASQAYRMAVAKADVASMTRASAQLLDIAKNRGGGQPQTPPSASGKSDVGAPKVEGPAGRAEAEEKRRLLLEKPGIL